MSIKAKRSGGQHDVHPLEAERLATGKVPQGWHSGMVKIPDNYDEMTRGIKPNFEGMGGSGDDGYDAMKDNEATRRYRGL
jgi:hypothetical protein